MEKLEHSYVAGGNVNGVATGENSLSVPQNAKCRATIRPSNSAPGYITKRNDKHMSIRNLARGRLKREEIWGYMYMYS